jgi:hypothetical protein
MNFCMGLHEQYEKYIIRANVMEVRVVRRNLLPEAEVHHVLLSGNAPVCSWP